MKALMISIKPKWVAKILNGEKTIEIRKTMPKCDLPIDVYIYCTKGEQLQVQCKEVNTFGKLVSPHWNTDKNEGGFCGFNGKVVAKFTLNKVEQIGIDSNGFCYEFASGDVLKDSCLSFEEMAGYLNYWVGSIDFNLDIGYAWYISNLVIFDKPKELSEFYKVGHYEDLDDCFTDEKQINGKWCIPLKKAPQSFAYIEV